MSEEETVTPSKEEILDLIEGKEVEVQGESSPEASPEPELSEAEQEAVSKGWKSEGVEGKRALSAEEFLDRAPIYDKIHSQGKKIKKQQESIDAFNDYLGKVDEKAYKRVLTDLKTKKTEAMEQMDHARVVELDDEIQDHKATKVEKTDAVSAAFSSFLESNEWYDKSSDNYDPKREEKAEFHGFQFQKNNPSGYTEAEFFAYISKKMAEDTPAPKPKAAAVQGGKPIVKSKPKGSSKFSLADVTDELDLKIAKTLIRNGDVKEDQWLKSYFGE